MGIIAKTRRLDWLQRFLWVAVIGCIVSIFYGIYILDFKTFIPVAGTFAAIIAVILIYQEMNLKNRPYLHVDRIPKLDINKTAQKATCVFAIKNSGPLPAYGVFFHTKLKINDNEIEKKPTPETEPVSIYPNQTINNTAVFEYTLESKTFYSIEIGYKGPNKKPYYFEGEYEINPTEGTITVIKTI